MASKINIQTTNDGYYLLGSDGSRTKLSQDNQGYLHWTQPDGKKMKTRKTYKIINPIPVYKAPKKDNIAISDNTRNTQFEKSIQENVQNYNIKQENKALADKLRKEWLSSPTLDSKQKENIINASDSEILQTNYDHINYEQNHPQPQIGQAQEYSEEEHKRRQKLAEKEKEREEKVEGLHRLHEFTNNSPVRFLPFIYPFTELSIAHSARQYGDENLYTSAGANGVISGLVDTATLALGVPTMRSIAGSVIGGEVGKYIGEKYDHPILGEITGAVIGGGVPDLAKNFVQNARQALRNYNIARTFNKSINNTKDFLHKEFYHVAKEPFKGQPRIYGDDNWGFHVTDDPQVANKIYKNFKEQGYNPVIMSGDMRMGDVKYRIDDPGSFSSWADENFRWIYDDVDYSLGLHPQESEALRFSNEANIIAYPNKYESIPERDNISYAILNPTEMKINNIQTLPQKIEALEIPKNEINSPFQQYLINFHDNLPSHNKNIQKSGMIGPTEYKIAQRPDGTYGLFNTDTFETIDFKNEQELLNYLKNLHSDYINSLHPAERELYLKYNTVPEIDMKRQFYRDWGEINPDLTPEVKKVTQDIVDTKISDDYQDKFIKFRTEDWMNQGFSEESALELANGEYNAYITKLQNLQETYTPKQFSYYKDWLSNYSMGVQGFTTDNTTNLWLRPRKFGDKYSITRKPNELFSDDLYDIENTIGHEFEHLIYNMSDPIREHTSFVFKEYGSPLEHIKPEYKNYVSSLDSKSQAYISDENELHSFLRPIAEEAERTGESFEQVYKRTPKNIRYYLNFFDDDYVINIGSKMLTTLGISTAGYNLLSNNDNTNSN